MNQDYFTLKDLIATKVSKDELMYEGFESLYGNKQIRPPKMDYAHGDFRTIHIGWIPPQYYTKTSHYLLQVSEDNVNWRGLRFDGQDFGWDIGTITTVFSNNIAHTRIPFKDGGIRILYYRAATVSKDGEISEWSNSIVGNTFYVEQSDIRGTDFVYPLQGTIQLTSEFDTGQFSYIAEGGMTISGAATWDGWFDYIAYTGTGEIKLTSSFQKEQEVDIVEVGSGIIQTGGLAWKEVNKSEEVDLGITNVQTIYGIIEDTNRYACWYKKYSDATVYRKLFDEYGDNVSDWDPSQPYTLNMEKMSETRWLKINGNQITLHSSTAQVASKTDFDKTWLSIRRFSDTQAYAMYSSSGTYICKINTTGDVITISNETLLPSATVRSLHPGLKFGILSENKVIIPIVNTVSGVDLSLVSADFSGNISNVITLETDNETYMVHYINNRSMVVTAGVERITLQYGFSISGMTLSSTGSFTFNSEDISNFKYTTGDKDMGVYVGASYTKLYSRLFFK